IRLGAQAGGCSCHGNGQQTHQAEFERKLFHRVSRFIRKSYSVFDIKAGQKIQVLFCSRRKATIHQVPSTRESVTFLASSSARTGMAWRSELVRSEPTRTRV